MIRDLPESNEGITEVFRVCEHPRSMQKRDAGDSMRCDRPATHSIPRSPLSSCNYLCSRHAQGWVRSMAAIGEVVAKPTRIGVIRRR